jgi:diaminohydroxyphosphoribosylaminopyrimidine deaminase/5-amino-6-(5-phosphoribosylamino)uracil reductase
LPRADATSPEIFTIAMLSAEQYMRQALDLARLAEGRTRPNPAVGAVVVADGHVVGEGYHPEAGQPHAEIFALRAAGEAARGADMYVTLEPCSHHGRTGPCTEAILAAGLRRVFIGTQDPNPLVAGRGIARLRGAGVEVACGILEGECRRLIAPFAKHITTGLPYVTLKSAVTLDGKTATSTGDSQWITNAASRAYVHRVRDKVDAVVVGIGTVLKDNPRLTTRLVEGGGRDALRVVVDSRLQIPGDAALLHLDSPVGTLIATTGQASSERYSAIARENVEILTVSERAGRVDLVALLGELGRRGIQSLLLEGGAVLNQAFLEAGLVDRMMVFVAPKVLGGNDGKGIFTGCGAASLAQAVRLREIRTSRFDDDILIEGEVMPCLPA